MVRAEGALAAFLGAAIAACGAIAATASVALIRAATLTDLLFTFISGLPYWVGVIVALWQQELRDA